MDPYDTQAVRAVWERVRLSHEQLLVSMIAREQQDRDFYRRIARQAGPMGKRLLSIATEEEKHLQQLRELYNSLYQDIAPGETVRCMESFSNVYVDGEAVDAVYEITVMDLYHQIPEKLVFTIDTATLDVFGPGVE